MKRIEKWIKSAAGKVLPFAAVLSGIALVENPSVERLSYFCIAVAALILYLFYGVVDLLGRLADYVTGEEDESA